MHPESLFFGEKFFPKEAETKKFGNYAHHKPRNFNAWHHPRSRATSIKIMLKGRRAHTIVRFSGEQVCP